MEEDLSSKTEEITDPEIISLTNMENDDIDYRKRRHDDWQENYMLSRDKVIINRLTQRQTVNIPLIKYVLNTLLKEMTDPPQLYFNNADNDQQRELFYNEYWKEIFKTNKLVLKDHVDKKQNAMYGRAYKKISIVGGKVKISLVDAQDMLISRMVDPTDIDSAPDLIECGIWTPLETILRNKDYDKKEVARLKDSFEQEDDSGGKLEADENFQKATEKFERLKVMGVENTLNPVVGETYIELHQAFRYEYNEDLDERVIFRYVLAKTGSGIFKLHKASLESIIGKTSDNFWRNHYPYTSWASDPEATDWWSDGIVDIIRPINNVLNVWISQLVENRTLQNFSMFFYDSSKKDFVPQTFQPQPWAKFPVPGNPNEIIKNVETGDLSGTLEELTFLISIAEKATAANATAGGETTTNVTLGDVELALANAQKRILMQQIFYVEDWKELGLKYTKMLEAAGDKVKSVTIYKKGRLGIKTYKKTVGPTDWKSDNGYLTEIKTITDKQQEDLEAVQKLQVLKNEMPTNVPLLEIYHRKLMQFSALTPDEVSRVEEFEKQNRATALNPEVGAEVATPGGGTPPQVPDIAMPGGGA